MAAQGLNFSRTMIHKYNSNQRAPQALSICVRIAGKKSNLRKSRMFCVLNYIYFVSKQSARAIATNKDAHAVNKERKQTGLHLL